MTTKPAPSTEIGSRIAVVGTSGSGKSRLARQIADGLGYLHIELDALSWDPNWTQVAPEILYERTQQAISAEKWVIDGNYSNVRELVWMQVETVIWLDYSRSLVMWRVIKRTLQRTLTRQTLWNGNREPFSRIFSRDSVILWAWQTYDRRRAQYTELLTKPEYNHIRFLRFRLPRQTDTWLKQLISAQ